MSDPSGPGPDDGPRLSRWTGGAFEALDVRRWRVYLATWLRQGVRRVQGAFVPNLQAAVAATVAFLLARHGLGHPVPLFAPVATYLCLGFTRNRRPRRVLEMGVGATVGIWLGELMGEYAGMGWWQVLVVMVVAPLVGRFVDRSEMVTFQAAMQSLTVVGMSAASLARPSAFGRWTDALVGTLVALAYSMVVPSRVTARARRYAKNSLVELGKAVETLAAGIRTADDERLKDVVGQLLVVQQIVDDARATRASATQTVALNRSLRRDRAELAELGRVLTLTERAATTVYVLARQSRGIVPETGPLPDLADLTERAARVLTFLGGSVGNFVPPQHARRKALELAGDLRPGHDPDASVWRTGVVVSLLRALVVDLLQLSGLSRQEARSALPIDAASCDPEDDPLPEDGPSPVWGHRGREWGRGVRP